MIYMAIYLKRRYGSCREVRVAEEDTDQGRTDIQLKH